MILLKWAHFIFLSADLYCTKICKAGISAQEVEKQTENAVRTQVMGSSFLANHLGNKRQEPFDLGFKVAFGVHPTYKVDKEAIVVS